MLLDAKKTWTSTSSGESWNHPTISLAASWMHCHNAVDRKKQPSTLEMALVEYLRGT